MNGEKNMQFTKFKFKFISCNYPFKKENNCCTLIAELSLIKNNLIIDSAGIYNTFQTLLPKVKGFLRCYSR